MNLACNYGAKPDQYKANKYSNYFSGFFLSGIVLPFVLPPSGSLHYCCNNVPTLLFHKMFICITLSWMYVCIVYTINNNIFVSILVQMLEDCPIYFLNIIVNYIYFFSLIIPWSCSILFGTSMYMVMKTLKWLFNFDSQLLNSRPTNRSSSPFFCILIEHVRFN